MNGKIYKIVYLPTGKPCYVGKTTRELNERFAQHCSKYVDTRIHRFIEEHGKENFSIKAIEEGIQSEEELKVLEKKYIKEYAKKYTLQNDSLYVAKHSRNYENIAEDTEYKDNNPVKCVETGEIFKNKFLASKAYNLQYHQMRGALKYGKAAGFKNNVDLHWQYVDEDLQKKNFVQRYYKIYVIKQHINDEWNPIYIGRTKGKFSVRLLDHMTNPASAIYEVLNSHPSIDFKIELLQDKIETLEEAAKLEYEYTLEYMKKYKLYNKNIGDKPNFATKTIDKRLLKVTVKDIIENEYFNQDDCKELCQCVENEYTFLTYEAASFQFSCQNHNVKKAIESGKPLQNIHIKHVDIHSLPMDKEVYINPYSVIAICNKLTDNVYKFYSTRIRVEDILAFIYAGRKNVLIYDLLMQAGKENVEAREIYKNIIFKKEADDLRKKEEKKYKQSIIEKDKLQLKEVVKKEKAVKKEKELKRPKTSEAMKKSWQGGSRAKRIASNGRRKRVVCVNTGEIFESVSAASEYFHVGKHTISRVCKGEQDGFKNKETGEKIYVHFEDEPIPEKPKSKTFSIYYVYCDNKVKSVIASKLDEKGILPYQKCNEAAPLHKFILQYGYEHFSVKKQVENIEDKTEALRIKKEHVMKLISEGNELYTNHM